MDVVANPLHITVIRVELLVICVDIVFRIGVLHFAPRVDLSYTQCILFFILNKTLNPLESKRVQRHMAVLEVGIVLLRIFAAKEIFERHVDDFLRLSVCAKVFPAFRELDTPKHTHLLVQHIKRFLPTWSRTVKVVEHFFYNATFGSFFFLLEISDAGQCALGVTICVVKCVLNGIFRFHRVEILRFFVTNILLETLYRPLNIFRSTAHHNFPS